MATMWVSSSHAARMTNSASNQAMLSDQDLLDLRDELTKEVPAVETFVHACVKSCLYIVR